MMFLRPVLAHVRVALAALVAGSQLVGCLVHERDTGDAGSACGDVCDAEVHADARLGDAAPSEDTGSPDAGSPDTGWCECPAPPPGCVYDGTPCGCSHMTCVSERCGREVCAPGTTCCNSSCGLCVPPGGSCIDLFCAPDCTAQDARSGGRCAGSPGWAWDGTACRALACRCEGTECDAMFPSEAECNAYFSACVPADCATDDATGVGACAAVLGYAFSARGCLPISGCSCTGTDCASVQGQSESACLDAHASCPVLFL